MHEQINEWCHLEDNKVCINNIGHGQIIFTFAYKHFLQGRNHCNNNRFLPFPFIIIISHSYISNSYPWKLKIPGTRVFIMKTESIPMTPFYLKLSRNSAKNVQVQVFLFNNEVPSFARTLRFWPSVLGCGISFLLMATVSRNQ